MTATVAADDAHRTGGVAAPPTGPAHDDVRLEHLRAGQTGEILFLVPGLEGDPTELAALASALIGPQDVYAVAPSSTMELPPGSGLEHMAELMVAAVRRLQPSGPFRLGGYSFGGLLALEMAQQLRTAGEPVEALFLIEAIYDERYWPRGIWARALIRRTGRHLLRIARMRPTKAIGEAGRRGVRLIQRLLRRTNDARDPLPAQSDASSMAGRAYSAITRYRPRVYDGSMVLIASSNNRQFGCDTVPLWSGYARHLQVERIEGDHLSVMHSPESAATVANVIDHRLAIRRETWAGLRPMPGFERPMILTTMRWFAVARLAHALAEAGFSVSACRPRAHALEVIDGLTSDCRLHRMSRMRSLAAAIRQAKPDIILPDDERALVLLRRLYARTQHTDPELAELIARSLGNKQCWPSITSRTGLVKEAHALSVSAPATAVIDNLLALRAWVAERNLPVVLKTDGSWGGQGVAIVREAIQLNKVWRSISDPPRLARALKRLVFDREAGPISIWARRARPIVNVQRFVEGRDAIATVACLDGEVHQLICLEVVQTSEARGPATVVRIIDNPAMAEAARRLVQRFGLSGFCGFDFMITDDGEALVLELNPRVTPTCHLLVERDHQSYQTIALFPAELMRSAKTTTTTSAVLDLPVRAPLLIQRGERMAAKRHRRLPQMARRFKRALTGSRP
jgi:thioesterase domain-containing protein